MSVTYISASQAMNPHDVGPDIADFPIKILSQGDSWFSIGAIPPWKTTNILLELNFTSSVAIVTCAEPGEDLITMPQTAANSAFISMLKGPELIKFDAILISGGGNDLIDALGNILLPKANWLTGVEGAAQYVNQTALNGLAQTVTDTLNTILEMRDSAANKSVPLYLHTYDYATPRPAEAGPGFGPWLSKAMGPEGVNIPENEWVDVDHYLNDAMAKTYQNFCDGANNVFLVKTLGTLVPAALNTSGPSNNWENEIHPTKAGYSRLAAVWEDALAKPPLNLT